MLMLKIGNIHKSYRIEVYAKGMYKIVNRAMYIVNHWKYSQPKRMRKGYYELFSFGLEML